MARSTAKSDPHLNGRSSFVVKLDFEMLKPQRLAVLILLSKGWRATSYRISKPRAIPLWKYHQSVHDHSLKVNYQAVQLWRRAGMIAQQQVNECSTEHKNMITQRGLKLLGEIAPEIIRAGRAYARSMILESVIDHRRKRKQNEEHVAMMREMELARKRKNRKRS